MILLLLLLMIFEIIILFLLSLFDQIALVLLLISAILAETVMSVYDLNCIGNFLSSPKFLQFAGRASGARGLSWASSGLLGLLELVQGLWILENKID